MPELPPPKPGKSPAVAFVLTFLVCFLPGIGQAYAGRLRRGLAFFLTTVAVWILAERLPTRDVDAAVPVIFMGLCLGWWGFLSLDAYWCALQASAAPDAARQPSLRGVLWAAFGLAAFVGFVAFLTQGIWVDLARKSDEGMTKRDHGLLMSAVSEYYGAHAGAYPASLEETVPSFLKKIPSAKLRRSNLGRYHPDSAAVRLGRTPTDDGGWIYEPATGSVWVNCTHTDSRSRSWAATY